MNIGKYISTVRGKISDDVQPYRVSTVDITDSLTVALTRAKQVRPSLAYSNGRLVAAAQEVDFTAAVSTTVRAELDRYSEAIAFLAAARILSNDNSDTLNVALADKWDARGMELLQI